MTADHGISFTPGQAQRTLQEHNAPELMWVPLFIKNPNQRSAKVDDHSGEQVYPLPTIADVLKVKVPWPVDGVSAMAAERSRRVKYFFNKPGQRLEVDGPQNQALALRGVTDRVARPEDGRPGCSRWDRLPTWSAAGPRLSAWPGAADWRPGSTTRRSSRTWTPTVAPCPP
jgi:hypothetical protein